MHEHTGKIFVPVPNKDLLKTEAEEWYERVYVSVYARCYNHGPGNKSRAYTCMPMPADISSQGALLSGQGRERDA